MNNKKIMIVEDNKAISEMYKLKFNHEGYEVFVCEDGVDALMKVLEFKPDVILLDIMMPHLNGFETLKALKNKEFNYYPVLPNLKIIILSNADSDKNIQKGLDYGADLYISKVDTTPQQIFSIVEKLLNN